MLSVSALPARGHACSVDAGVWSVPYEIDSISKLVPENGALVVRLACLLGPQCSAPPLDSVGEVLTPSGAKVMGSWTLHEGDSAVFVPSAPFARGAGYSVDLKGYQASKRTFDVVAPIVVPEASAFTGSVVLGPLGQRGDATTQRCCDLRSSCGPSCYTTHQIEVAQLEPRVSMGQAGELLQQQIEWKAVSVDTGASVSCVGCSKLPTIRDESARASYCVDISGRALVSGAQLALGRVCTSNGISVLARRETPAMQLPLCASTSEPAPSGGGEDAGADAGVGLDAGSERDAQPDLGGSDASAQAVATSEPEPANDSARDAHESCSVHVSNGRGAALGGWFVAMALALLSRRRRARALTR